MNEIVSHINGFAWHYLVEEFPHFLVGVRLSKNRRGDAASRDSSNVMQHPPLIFRSLVLVVFPDDSELRFLKELKRRRRDR